MKHVAIYTDGACSENPGPGGWAAVLMYKTVKKEISGNEPMTTNNRMEITAAIMALEALKQTCEVDLYTDSAYLSNAYNQHWIDNWQRSGWKKADKHPVENRDLWERLLKLTEWHKVVWHKVKGHADDEFNNRCDQLARNEIKKLKAEPDAEKPPEAQK